MSSLQPLSGRRAWVTGSSRGIGRSIARALLQAGVRVAFHGTCESSPSAFSEGTTMTDLLTDIAAEEGLTVGTDLFAVTGDLTDPITVSSCADRIRNIFGSIDILVNCAGGDIGCAGVDSPNGGKAARNNAIDISLADMDAIIGRNLRTCILCCREVGPGMRERQAGTIINIGSVAGLIGQDHQAIYSTAKAAVHHYTRCLADHMRQYGVRVNAVAPGEITSPRFLASRPIDERRQTRRGSLSRYGDPEEVAQVVLFLAGDDASYISGQVIRIDGAQQCWAG